MTERVEEIRRRIKQGDGVILMQGPEAPERDLDITGDVEDLLTALAQAEREREMAETIAHRAEHRANQAESERDEARAEVERLKEIIQTQGPAAVFCVGHEADLASVRAAGQEYLAAVEALAFEDSGGLGGNTQEDFDRANRAADALRAAMEGR